LSHYPKGNKTYEKSVLMTQLTPLRRVLQTIDPQIVNKIFRVLWNLGTNPDHEFSSSFCNIPFNTTLPAESRSSGYFMSFRSSTDILYALSLFSMRAKCFSCLILLHLITRAIFGERYRTVKLLVMHLFPVPSYLLRLSFSALFFSSTLNLSCFLSMKVQISHPFDIQRTVHRDILL
jgi:hypothetical protein